MFEPSDTPRLFGLPPGVPFAQALVQGLDDRLQGKPPQDWARLTIFVNTRRMERALTDALTVGPARLLPRIHLVSDLSHLPEAAIIPAPVPPLRLKLKLAAELDRLIERTPDIAPKSASLDLAETLAALFDEMQAEGVSLSDLESLTPEDHALHWQRSLKIASVLEPFFGSTSEPGKEARQRQAAEALINRWKAAPPSDPVIIAGSTGSRGTTRLLMQAAAGLPQGAVVLPGFDYDQPGPVWRRLDNALTGEDHPQFRFAALGAAMGLPVNGETVRPWTDIAPANPARARLISIALRPAPVTDHWITEGAAFTALAQATADMRLLSAPSEREEALAIAAALREAMANGRTATLVTPDRTLGRRVTAALNRWGILPDDSVGQPLHLTAAGRFLIHMAETGDGPLTLEGLVTLLKHPLCASGKSDRGPHLLATRGLEVFLRKKGVLEPDAAWVQSWLDKKAPTVPDGWADWLLARIASAQTPLPQTLSAHLTRLLTEAGAWAAGPAGADGSPHSGALWEEEAGEKAAQTLSTLRAEAEIAGPMTARAFRQLLKSELSAVEVRRSGQPHGNIRILGTLEARVGTDDLVILGGLNEGVWPAAPTPDPWMNRQMRLSAGLLLPERRIGLAAHDFQQAAAAGQVIFSRAIRTAEAQTVPSRWLSRLTNLIAGMGAAGEERLRNMKLAGDALLDIAHGLDAPQQTAPAPRPAPCPPLAKRPGKLSVTAIRTLIRDPYAIYARYVLNLSPIPGLVPEPDARLRGIVLHEVLEKGLTPGFDPADADALATLIALSDAEMQAQVPWPYTRSAWRARAADLLPRILEGERQRLTDARIHSVEATAEFPVPGANFTLTGRADRLDQTDTGGFRIYDYKSNAPSKSQVAAYDIQLPLQAALLDRDGFKGITGGKAEAAGYIEFGKDPRTKGVAFEEKGDQSAWLPDITWEKFLRLLAAYGDANAGYRAFDRVAPTGLHSDYAHLSRFGEWDLTTPATAQKVGP